MNLWIVLFTGLSIGGLSCLAVQGGLLASVIASREKQEVEKDTNKKNNFFPVVTFLTSKLFVYIILGFLLGAFGSALSLSLKTQAIIQIFSGVYMLAIALNLLNIHPVFRYFVIQPPRFLAKMIRRQSKSSDLFAPGFLGLMTVFIPCGTTLAMEALAISSGSPLNGALIMAVFTIGTMPLFFGLGFLTTVLGDIYRTKFLKIAAIAVLYLGLTSINGALNVLGSPVTIQTFAQLIPFEVDLNGNSDPVSSGKIVDGEQVIDIKVLPNGYIPASVQVKQGTPVKINLSSEGNLGCTSVFTIPKLGIKKIVPRNGTDSVEFTPNNKGKLAFTCSMGMYSGTIEVL